MAMILKLAWAADDLVENNEMINSQERRRCENTTIQIYMLYHCTILYLCLVLGLGPGVGRGVLT